MYLTFIDVRKAYDRVWRPGLWVKLRAAGIQGRMLVMIKEMYRCVYRRVMISGHTTDVFDVAAAVPQGAILSPFLYATYIDGLHQHYERKGWVYGPTVA